MTLREAVEYEIHASWWAGWISWPWLQVVAADYFAWKARRKFRRYRESMAVKAVILSRTKS